MKPVFILLSCLLFMNCAQSEKKVNTSPTAQNSYQTSCIEYIISQDSIYGGLRNHATETVSISHAIDQYVMQLKALEFSNCPDKFKSAFYKHIDAWIKFKVVSDKHPDLRGEMHKVLETIEKSKDSSEYNTYLDEVWATWGLVEDAMED